MNYFVLICVYLAKYSLLCYTVVADDCFGRQAGQTSRRAMMYAVDAFEDMSAIRRRIYGKSNKRGTDTMSSVGRGVLMRSSNLPTFP